MQSVRSITRYGSNFFSLPNLKRIISRNCYEARKIDITGGKQTFMFDTLAATKSLQQSGFTSSQAESIVYSLVQISQAKMDFINKNMVTKAQQEILLQQVLANISAIRKDMIILEKSEFSSLKHEYEKQNIEIQQLRRHFEDELVKMKAGMDLDINLERSRAKDAHAVSEKALDALKNRIEILASENDKHMSGLDNKIDKEIAQLLATYERYRNDIIKYAAGTVMTCLTLCLGFYRVWAS